MTEKLPSLPELVRETEARFEAQFGYLSRVAAASPGRVNVIGEHTDYNQGFVLPAAMPMWSVVLGKSRADANIRVFTCVDTGSPLNSFELDSRQKLQMFTDPSLKWANYIVGTIAKFPCESLPGFDCVINSSVPLGAGLSSSASLEAAVFTFLEALTGKQVDKITKALLCQKAEHDFANVPCGIMDQFASVLSQEGHLMLLDCRSEQVTDVPFNSSSHVFLVADSRVKHQLGDGAYRQRRAMCEAVAHKLGVSSLRDVDEQQLRSKSHLFDQIHFNRALHVVREIERTQQAVKALQESDIALLGRLMNESHDSLRDLYEVSCEEIDVLVSTARDWPGVSGSRITGGGFGGCCVTLAEESCVDGLIHKMTEAFQKFAKKPKFYLCSPENGSVVCSDLLSLHQAVQ